MVAARQQSAEPGTENIANEILHAGAEGHPGRAQDPQPNEDSPADGDALDRL
jgi:hypothetical protein